MRFHEHVFIQVRVARDEFPSHVGTSLQWTTVMFCLRLMQMGALQKDPSVSRARVDTLLEQIEKLVADLKEQVKMVAQLQVRCSFCDHPYC